MDKPAFPTVDTEKMMRLPMGVISPLWLMFAGAATMGAAFYWSRSFFKPTQVLQHTAKTAMHLDEFGLELQCAAIALHAFVGPPERHQGIAETKMDFGEVRLRHQYPAIACHRIVESPEVSQNAAARHLCVD